MPTGAEDDTHRRGRANEGSDHVDEQQSKRAKRRKYAVKACYECRRRKIRCDGESPCLPCLSRKRDCTTRARHDAPPAREYEAGQTEPSLSGARAFGQEGVAIDALLSRISYVEQQMKTVMNNSSGNPSAAELYENPADLTDTATTESASPGRYTNVDSEDARTFVGDTSSLHALRRIESQLDDLGVQIRPDSPLSSTRPLTPRQSSAQNVNTGKNQRSWLQAILRAYGIVPDQAEWKTFLHIYLDEIHGIYPFLHPPTVQQTYEYLWERSFMISPDDLERDEESRVSAAIVFLCLALGRSMASSRVDNANGTHSAGWSLYSVAVYLLRPLLDIAQDHPITLHGLQACGIMVIYLFRLDATEKAERILSLAISNAHILGLHRKATYVQMGVFDNEMCTRTWWCLYALDRRLCFCSGRPFVIQDIDNDVRNPFNVSDDWLGRHKSTTATVEELADEIEAEASIAHNTTMPYLEATISYSKIAGDAWKAVYGVNTVAHNGPNFVCDYLEVLLESWSQKLPPCLRYQANVPYGDQFSGSEWWQMKECLFNHMRCTFLKLLIRRPVASSTSSSLPTHQDIANEAICAQLACSIIEVFEKIPMAYPKYCIGFMNYMISSTIILFSIVVKNPGFKDIYKERILFAMQSIITYCRKTWVSAKTIRAASKLNTMVQSILGFPADGESDKRSNHRDEQDGRLYNTHFGQNEGNALAAMRPPALMRAFQRQSTPPGSLVAQHKSNASLISNSSTATDVSTRSNGTQSTRTYVPFPSSADSAPPESSSQAAARSHKALQRTTDMLSTSEYIPEAPIMWPLVSPNNEITGFPSLAMVDFDFEQSFGLAHSQLTPLSGPSLADLGNLER